MSFPIETISLGCRLNAYESERMATLAAKTATAPTIVINTCAVTSEAVRQSRQTIRRARKQNPNAKIVVSGCAAQLDAEGFAAMPEVGRVIGNADKLSPTVWAEHSTISDVFSTTTLPAGPSPLLAPQVRAHLEVQNGCDHRCTFCIIPFGRGRARSKPAPIIVEEALALVERGAREIVLTGVDLTSYGPDLGEDITLADPIEALLASLPGSIRLRLSSVDGAEIDERLFTLITQNHQITPYLHLSLQAGDNMILKRMKRRHSREDAITLCERLHAARGNIAFGADLIAGFPTETEDMFENTLSLIRSCALSYVHVFPFSPREGTPAARMPQIPRQTVKDRAARLREAADAALYAHLKTKIGTTDLMLIEQTVAGIAKGKLPDFTEVAVDKSLAPGMVVPVKMSRTDGRHLWAEVA